MVKKIWLDDEFAPLTKHFLYPVPGLPPATEASEWVWVRTSRSFFALVADYMPVDIVAIDNDLGLYSAEGIDVLQVLFKQIQTNAQVANQFRNTRFIPITNNSARAEEMRKLIHDMLLFLCINY